MNIGEEKKTNKWTKMEMEIQEKEEKKTKKMLYEE